MTRKKQDADAAGRPHEVRPASESKARPGRAERDGGSEGPPPRRSRGGRGARGLSGEIGAAVPPDANARARADGAQLRITLVKSGVSQPERQKRTLLGLGLGKMHRTVVRKDTPEIRGMVGKVAHLVRVEEA